MAKIPYLIIDFGGVLFPIQPPITKSDDGLRFVIQKQLVINAYLQNNSSVNQLENHIDSLGQITFSVSELRQIKASLNIIDTQLLHDLQHLKTNYSLIALVNEAPYWTEIRIKIHHLESLFAHVFDSSALQFEKPDPQIFNYVLSKLNSPPDACVFIDDNIQNIQAAANMGFAVYQYSTYKSFSENILPQLLPVYA